MPTKSLRDGELRLHPTADDPSPNVLSHLSAGVRAAPVDPAHVRDLVRRSAHPSRKDESGGRWFENLLLEQTGGKRFAEGDAGSRWLAALGMPTEERFGTSFREVRRR